MARGYLQRIAHRAVESAAGTLRPRRLVRATAPLDEPMPAARMPAARPPAAQAIAVAEAIGVPSAASAPPHEQTPAAPSGELGEPIAAPTPVAPAPAPTPPPAAVAPTLAAPRANARRDLVRRNVTTAPDPLAVALAAAVRWTSGDEPDEPAAPDRTPRADRVAPTERAAPSVAPRAAAAILRPGERERAPDAAPAPPPTLRDRSAREAPAPRATPVPRPAPPARSAAAAPSPQRYTEIHIGSVDVQIVPEAPAPPPPPRAATAPAAAPSAPLARGLTSRFTLRQS